ncbi:MAG: DNA mismatch repair endonuclease MutL [Oscillospiraceae bacterium]|jgi:DNA mismatch repair protein MutL|nr:DNA mismatch repair endonuclease MutL [Oscillospiraceae bacterium]
MIRKLPPHLANLIAAGEVVERPSSAAKELVENAIDAGAKNITVEIQNGGKTFLRVTDDGCGIAAAEVETAFLRHATSKLQRAEDLEAIFTLGFRGEALAAICAVSRVDVLTKTAEADFGTSLHLEAGTVTLREDAGCPNGTTVIVRDLFFNTPARMKFMKRDTLEASYVHSTVQKLALAHPDVSLRLIKDGEQALFTPGDGKLLSAIYATLGRQLAQEMLALDSAWENNTLKGFVSAPSATRGTRANQLFFVNGRAVQSRTLVAALDEAYKNQMLPGRFPSCVLHLHVPENRLDVNVHPAKTEVKFLNEREIFECVHYGVLGALRQSPRAVQMQAPKASTVVSDVVQKPAAPKETFYRTMSASDFRAFSETLQKAKPVTPAQSVLDTLKPPLREKPPVTPTTPEAQQAEIALPEQPLRIVGELFDTYILVEQGSTMLLIDKHAAHERILFEKLRAQAQPVMPQLLLQPLVFTPGSVEAAVLLENAEILQSLGYELSDYGGGTLAARQIPAEIDPDDALQTLSALARDLLSGGAPSALREKLLHTIACKAAIKGGHSTAPAEREALVREVLSREDIKYCPHGRPICAEMTKAQLERQFKRA